MLQHMDYDEVSNLRDVMNHGRIVNIDLIKSGMMSYRPDIAKLMRPPL